MTRIEVSRSGGFAGLSRTWSVEVSPAEAEERWLPLLEQAEAENAETLHRDRFIYHIVVVGYRDAMVPESAVQGPWKELLERARNAPPKEPAEELPDEPAEEPGGHT